MSLLAAAVPVAVLVLAWDEATPAVRALVEATEAPAPALDSVVVLVPAAAGALTQEEFLPLGEEPAPPAATPDEDSAPAEATVLAAAAETEPAESAPLPLAPANFFPVAPAPIELLATDPAAATPEKPVPAPLAWSVVRVLRLSSFSLPELTALSHQALPLPIWQQSVAVPATPYLGSQSTTLDSQALDLPEIATAPRLVAGSSGAWVATLPPSPAAARAAATAAAGGNPRLCDGRATDARCRS
jgi:hypothetical protein